MVFQLVFFSEKIKFNVVFFFIAKSYFRSSSSASCTFHSHFPDSSEQSRLLAENSYLRQQLHDLEQRLEVADSSRQPLTPQVIAAKPLRGHNVLSLKNQSVFENEQKFLDLSSESFQSRKKRSQNRQAFWENKLIHSFNQQFL